MKIKPIKEKHDKPSKANDSPADYTAEANAPDRVMFLNLLFFKYGTNDKAHGAAIVLAIMLLLFMLIVFLSGLFICSPEITEKILTWTGGAFLFVAGVAVGKNGSAEDNGKK